MAGINEKVAALVAEGMDDRDEIVDRILSDAKPEELMAIVRPVIAWEVANRLRQITRRVEQKVFNESTRVVSGSPGEMRHLLTQTFTWNEDGDRVTWGEATVPQHESRAKLLRSLADRSVATAMRHEQAAAIIAEAKVSCLAEVYGTTARKAA